MTKYFVDSNGVYLGGFAGVEPPLGAVEVYFSPNNATQVWDFEAGAYGSVSPPTPIEQIRAIEAAKADDTAKVIRQTLLMAVVDKAMERPEVVAMLQAYPAEAVKAQVISTLVDTDPGFKLMWELEQAIGPLRAQLP
mgnify:CR=1 FL=1|tara:strand:- start:5358 stop:5768 length:411 start_codon:yes stop_codon:yes gene_type:complete